MRQNWLKTTTDLVNMPQRKCTRKKEKVLKPSKRIVLAIELEKYKKIVKDPKAFREWVDENIIC